MGSMLGNLPSYDPHNFSQLRPSDKDNPSFPGWEVERLRGRPTPTYHPTHNRTLPPPDQVISTESKNILIRHFYKHAEEKLRPKRAASEFLAPEPGSKHQRPSTSYSQQ